MTATFQAYFNSNVRAVYVREGSTGLGSPVNRAYILENFGFSEAKRIATNPYTWIPIRPIDAPDAPPATTRIVESAKMRQHTIIAEAVGVNVVNQAVVSDTRSEGRTFAEELRAQIHAAPQRPTFAPATATIVEETPAPVTVETVNTTASNVSDGFYTMVRADGSHVTFRIRTQGEGESFAPNKRIIATLTGSDNESSYTGWGFVNPIGTISVWNKMASKVGDWQSLAFALVTGDWKSAGLQYATESGNCYVCNRRLTTPESISAGIGPVCAGKV